MSTEIEQKIFLIHLVALEINLFIAIIVSFMDYSQILFYGVTGSLTLHKLLKDGFVPVVHCDAAVPETYTGLPIV